MILVAIEFFPKLDEIGNNANIGIRSSTTWKQKNSNNTVLLPVSIEPLLCVCRKLECNRHFPDAQCKRAIMVPIHRFSGSVTDIWFNGTKKVQKLQV